MRCYECLINFILWHFDFTFNGVKYFKIFLTVSNTKVWRYELSSQCLQNREEGRFLELSSNKWSAERRESDNIFHVYVLFIKSPSGVTNGILFIYTSRLVGCLYCVALWQMNNWLHSEKIKMHFERHQTHCGLNGFHLLPQFWPQLVSQITHTKMVCISKTS